MLPAPSIVFLVGLLTCGVFDEFTAEYAGSVKELADCYVSDYSEILESIQAVLRAR